MLLQRATLFDLHFIDCPCSQKDYKLAPFKLFFKEKKAEVFRVVSSVTRPVLWSGIKSARSLVRICQCFHGKNDIWLCMRKAWNDIQRHVVSHPKTHTSHDALAVSQNAMGLTIEYFKIARVLPNVLKGRNPHFQMWCHESLGVILGPRAAVPKSKVGGLLLQEDNGHP